MDRTIFDDDHDAFRVAVRTLLERELAPRLDRSRTERCIDIAVWESLGEAGFLGFMVPEEFGGGGMRDFRYNAVLGEELSRYGAAYGSSIGINTDVVASYLLDLTTDEQRRRWLPPFAAGRLITAIAMTEPTAGSDLAAIKTTARRDGNDWIIDGSKTFITNGARADLCIVAARTTAGERGRGITLFAVETGMPGFTRGRKLDKVGQPEADTAELFFTDVRVPSNNVVGEVDGGFAAMMERLPVERLSCAVACVAHAAEALDQTVAYSRERTAFGQAIGHFQHNKFVMATLQTELDITRSFVDACIAAQVAGRLDAVDAAKAKYWASEVQNRVTDACVQLHGGYGYMQETPIARSWTDARVTRIWAGSNEIMQEIVGRSMGL